MGATSLDDILLTPLKRIETVGGDVIHALRKSDDGFYGFGEVYFSWVEYGAIKAWKCHQYMTLNLVIPLGEVNFVFHIKDQKNRFRIDNIGEERYVRLTVPPRIWFGFQGLSEPRSLLMNVADLPHDPNEVLRKSVEEIQYEWSLR